EECHHDDRFRACRGARLEFGPPRSNRTGVSSALPADHDDDRRRFAWRSAAGDWHGRGRRVPAAPRGCHHRRPPRQPGADALHDTGPLSAVRPPAPVDERRARKQPPGTEPGGWGMMGSVPPDIGNDDTQFAGHAVRKTDAEGCPEASGGSREILHSKPRVCLLKEVSMQELLVGDPAPGIRLVEFLKGAPLSVLEFGKIYVLEFWATWCGPCQANVPHLSDLQDKYPRATFIGVAVMEPDIEAVGIFVEEMGNQSRYRIAVEEPLAGRSGREGGSMTRHWLEA